MNIKHIRLNLNVRNRRMREIKKICVIGECGKSSLFAFTRALLRIALMKISVIGELSE
jgi:hypothetical protein